jgi:hypothetical protein
MAGQVELYAAIVTKLGTDTVAGGLVELTLHSTVNAEARRIGRDKPIKKGQVPFLGVFVFQSRPLSSDGVIRLQQARVIFKCNAAEELTAMRIADRMDFLLQAKTQEDAVGGTNRGYYDFSDSNISNRSTVWAGRSVQDFDDKTDVWAIEVSADLIWIGERCS